MKRHNLFQSTRPRRARSHLFCVRCVHEDIARGQVQGVGIEKSMEIAQRASWIGNETVDIVAPISRVKNHSSYNAAKTGDFSAAANLVMDLMDDKWLDEFGPRIVVASPILIGVHAVEGVSVNKIGAAMDEWLALWLNLQRAEDIVQVNRVGTQAQADGIACRHRLFSAARFRKALHIGLMILSAKAEPLPISEDTLLQMAVMSPDTPRDRTL